MHYHGIQGPFAFIDGTLKPVIDWTISLIEAVDFLDLACNLLSTLEEVTNFLGPFLHTLVAIFVASKASIFPRWINTFSRWSLYYCCFFGEKVSQMFLGVYGGHR